ncbi:MAG: hydroxymethylbilane synthase [SAR324 cluster bacterium]|nr:hydroxymethylbilane synthase [SAR324 cluster bacterium]MBL7035191.1 hydroxymethylbilane synthase [SAR324 cluster bacterium]
MSNAFSTSGSKSSLVIATRGSLLALWQAEWVQQRILDEYPETSVELLILKTTGDRIQDRPLSEVGGKGLFIKELESALLDGRADMAVHSMKDVTSEFPEGLEISVITEREEAGDAWICQKYGTLNNFPNGAVVGTSSLRRASQLNHHRPDLKIKSLRGNVQTRLRKLDEGEVDAAILAVAGLKRLKLEARITEILPLKLMLPAIGQGAIGIETRIGDQATLSRIEHLNHPLTWDCLQAERTLLAVLEGNCQLPLAGYCILDGEELFLRAAICDSGIGLMLAYEARASRKNANKLGQDVAEWLLDNGAEDLLRKLKNI